MEKKEKRKVRKNEGQGPYMFRYPLLDGKAEYYYFDKKRNHRFCLLLHFTKWHFFSHYILNYFLIQHTFELLYNTAKALGTPSKYFWLWPLLWTAQTANGLSSAEEFLVSVLGGHHVPTHQSIVKQHGHKNGKRAEGRICMVGGSKGRGRGRLPFASMYHHTVSPQKAKH